MHGSHSAAQSTGLPQRRPLAGKAVVLNTPSTHARFNVVMQNVNTHTASQTPHQAQTQSSKTTGTPKTVKTGMRTLARGREASGSPHTTAPKLEAEPVNTPSEADQRLTLVPQRVVPWSLQGARAPTGPSHHHCDDTNTDGFGGVRRDVEEEYERLIFSQPTDSGLLPGQPDESREEHAAQASPSPPRSRGNMSTRPTRSDAPFAEADEDTRAAAAAASRFSAMKLGIAGADMNATLTGGTGGDDVLDPLRAGGLLSFQHTFQSSFGATGIVQDANLNDTLGHQQRAAMLLSLGRGSGTVGSTFDAKESKTEATGLNTTLNSTTGLGGALEDIRAALRSARQETSTLSVDSEDAPRPTSSEAFAGRPTAATNTHVSVGGNLSGVGGGARVRFAHSSGNTTLTSPPHKTVHLGTPAAVSAPRSSLRASRTSTTGSTTKPTGIASTRTMAALGRLYAPEPSSSSSSSPAPAPSSLRTSAMATASAFSAVTAQQAPLASLRFEALTEDALQRRFGPPERLCEHLHRERDAFLRDDLSVYSIRSSAMESVFSHATAAPLGLVRALPNRSPAGNASTTVVTALHNHAPASSENPARKTKAGVAPSALTQAYIEDLYTPDTVLREIAAKSAALQQQQEHARRDASTKQRKTDKKLTSAPLWVPTTASSDGDSSGHASPNATRHHTIGADDTGRAGDKDDPTSPSSSPPPDLNDPKAVALWKAERRRAREAQQRLAVRDVTGTGKTGGDFLHDALDANRRLLHEYALRRPADEKLRNKVTQWLDRVHLVVLHDPRRAARPAEVGQLLGHTRDLPHKVSTPSQFPPGTGAFVLVEEDPSDLHDAVMRVLHAEEADVQARNLLERGRLVEANASHAAAKAGESVVGRGSGGGGGGGPREHTSGVFSQPMATRSGLFGRRDVTSGFGDDETAAASSRLHAFHTHQASNLRHATLSSRLNPWGYSLEELENNEAPTFAASTTTSADADTGDGEEAAMMEMLMLCGGQESEMGRRERIGMSPVRAAAARLALGSRTASTQAVVTAATTLAAGERDLLDFAMHTVLKPSHARHLRAFVEWRSPWHPSVMDGSCDHRAAPSFTTALKPAELVTTGQYESASVAWLRCVNEALHLCVTQPLVSQRGSREQSEGREENEASRVRPRKHAGFADEATPSTPVGLTTPTTTRVTSADTCETDVVTLAALPVRLQYGLPQPQPQQSSPAAATRSSAGAALAPLWEVSLDLLDVVARLPLRVVDKLLEVASTRPVIDTPENGTNQLDEDAETTRVAGASSTGYERPHSRSQSFFTMGNASTTSLHRLETADGLRGRGVSVAVFSIPAWCKVAWKKAVADAAMAADRPVSSTPSSCVGSPHNMTSPHLTRGATAAAAASPFTVATRPDNAELLSFVFETSSVVEQSRWRVRAALQCAVALNTDVLALRTPSSDALRTSVETDLVVPTPATTTAAESAETETGAMSSTAPRTETMASGIASSVDQLKLPFADSLPPFAAADNAFFFSLDIEKQQQPGGPHWLGILPIAPPSRRVYPFDMRHLYVIATLAVEETDDQLLPRLQRLRTQYKKQCQEALRSGSKARAGGRGSNGSVRGSLEGDGALVTTGGGNRHNGPNGLRSHLTSAKSMHSLPTLSSQVMTTSAIPALLSHASGGTAGAGAASTVLGDALEQWAAAQRLVALETAFIDTVSSMYRNEAAVNHFNLHVQQFNRYQESQRWLWSPIFRNGLRVAYHLCLLLAERGLENLPESYVKLLHPVALFVGCMGGHREMRANLPEVLLDIVERAKRVHLPLDPIIAAAFRDRASGEDSLLETVATICDGSHLRKEATAPYGTLQHPARAFTDREREAVKVVEETYAAECEEVIRPSDIVSCLATESDELSVPLKLVSFPSVRFHGIEPLSSQ